MTTKTTKHPRPSRRQRKMGADSGGVDLTLCWLPGCGLTTNARDSLTIALTDGGEVEVRFCSHEHVQVAKQYLDGLIKRNHRSAGRSQPPIRHP